MKLPTETICGRTYQPFEIDSKHSDCHSCCINKLPNSVCEEAPCSPKRRDDGLNVYYVEVD